MSAIVPSQSKMYPPKRRVGKTISTRGRIADFPEHVHFLEKMQRLLREKFGGKNESVLNISLEILRKTFDRKK